MNSLAGQSKEQLLVLVAEQAALIQQLQSLVKEQAEALKAAQQEMDQLKQEIEQLKSGGSKPTAKTPPDFVKANRKPPREAKPRKKRAHGSTHHRLAATEEVVHACDTCPDCGRALSGGWEHSRRQVIEIPPVALQVVDHVRLARRCGVCQQVCVPEVDFGPLTGGSGQYGVRMVSLLAYLRTVGRLPKRTLQAVLASVYGVRLSVGAITGLLQKVARQGAGTYARLQEEVRGSPFVHADETGWREDGHNGYIWSFSTPKTRYFVYAKSRSHTVPEGVLGEAFGGVLVSDFYSGYHYYPGLHQRCWVHLLRDLHELKQKYPSEGVRAWGQSVRAVYDAAKAFWSAEKKAREAARLDFQAQLLELAVPYVDSGLPQSVLARRMVRFEAELFTFVEYPDVPSENNAAERSIRPRVIARKISGGTRSAVGSSTMAVLASLFETWRLRGEASLEACRQMLMTASKPTIAPAS